MQVCGGAPRPEAREHPDQRTHGRQGCRFRDIPSCPDSYRDYGLFCRRLIKVSVKGCRLFVFFYPANLFSINPNPDPRAQTLNLTLIHPSFGPQGLRATPHQKL